MDENSANGPSLQFSGIDDLLPGEGLTIVLPVRIDIDVLPKSGRRVRIRKAISVGAPSEVTKRCLTSGEGGG